MHHFSFTFPPLDLLTFQFPSSKVYKNMTIECEKFFFPNFCRILHHFLFTFPPLHLLTFRFPSSKVHKNATMQYTAFYAFPVLRAYKTSAKNVYFLTTFAGFCIFLYSHFRRCTVLHLNFHRQKSVKNMLAIFGDTSSCTFFVNKLEGARCARAETCTLRTI